MTKIESFIKKNAPGSLYGEYAKKEECWNTVKENNFKIDLSVLKEDLESSASATKRQRISDDEIAKAAFEASLERINSVHHEIWKNIEEWGQAENKLSKYQCDMTNTIANRLRNNRHLTAIEIGNAHKILDTVTEEAPELFFQLDELTAKEENSDKQKTEIDIETIKAIVKWDKRNKRLKDFEYRFMADLAEGNKPCTEHNKKIASWNLSKVKKYGFEE